MAFFYFLSFSGVLFPKGFSPWTWKLLPFGFSFINCQPVRWMSTVGGKVGGWVATVGGAPGKAACHMLQALGFFQLSCLLSLAANARRYGRKIGSDLSVDLYIFGSSERSHVKVRRSFIFFVCFFFCCALSKKSIFKYCLLPVKSVEERRVPWMSIAIMRTSRKNKQFPSGFLRPRLVYLSIQL